MKLLVSLTFIVMLGLPSQTTTYFGKQINSIDTSAVKHVQDGLINEWSDSSFQIDKLTNIQYAADNDEQNLYVAMKIADFGMEMKMIRMGMSFYIDLKGKKKEGCGIEFPLKRESEGGFNSSDFNNSQRTNQNHQGGGDLDKKEILSRFAIYLLSLKLFGFTDEDPVAQELERSGSVNINFSWDDQDVMCLEYLIPLKMFGDAASLNSKTISLGWKLNGIEMPTSSPTNTTTPATSTITTLTSRPGVGFRGGGGGRGYPSGGSTPNQANMEKMMQEQSFWTKYTFH